MILGVVLLLATAAGTATAMTDKERLGKKLFFDSDLSEPAGQSCSDCHHQSVAFVDRDTDLPVSEGVIKGRFGNRNSPTAAYASFSPDFHFNGEEFAGGQFWDGRADDLIEQAKGPFLNPLEMNNPDRESVIMKIRESNYARLFEKVHGAGALDDVETAYNQMAEAIAVFEETNRFNKFSSKFDFYLAGKVELTPEEERGLEEFIEYCNVCHVIGKWSSEVTEDDKIIKTISMPNTEKTFSIFEDPLFTDFTYENIGIPRNENNPFYTVDDTNTVPVPEPFNPEGFAFTDLGLGGFLRTTEWASIAEYHDGQMKVSTLRNIDKTPPYMHNGVFETLEMVVHFYNTRDVMDRVCSDSNDPGMGTDCWPLPEVDHENIFAEEVSSGQFIGNLNIDESTELEIVAFMKTLTDGYDPKK